MPHFCSARNSNSKSSNEKSFKFLLLGWYIWVTLWKTLIYVYTYKLLENFITIVRESWHQITLCNTIFTLSHCSGLRITISLAHNQWSYISERNLCLLYTWSNLIKIVCVSTVQNDLMMVWFDIIKASPNICYNNYTCVLINYYILVLSFNLSCY